MIDFYNAVVDFCTVPATVLGIILSLIYLGIAIRNVVNSYITTGKILFLGLETKYGSSDPIDECFAPHIFFGIFGSMVLYITPLIMLLVWPVSFSLIILFLCIVVPVRKKRQRYLFLQSLKGETSGQPS
jgi:hypothetical protein